MYKEDAKFRLSERNCVEIIMKLIQKSQLNLYFTLEGREYITPRQLETEIKNEVIVHGGMEILRLVQKIHVLTAL